MMTTQNSAAATDDQEMLEIAKRRVSRYQGQIQEIAAKLQAASVGSQQAEIERQKQEEIRNVLAPLQEEEKGLSGRIDSLTKLLEDTRRLMEDTSKSVESKYAELLKNAPQGDPISEGEASRLRSELSMALRGFDLAQQHLMLEDPGYTPLDPGVDPALLQEPAPRLSVSVPLVSSPAPGPQFEEVPFDDGGTAGRSGKGAEKAHREPKAHKQPAAQPKSDRYMSVPDAVDEAFYRADKKELKVGEILKLLKTMNVKAGPKDVSQAMERKLRDGRVSFNAENETYVLNAKKREKVTI